MRRWSRVHACLYRLTGGLLGNRLVGNDMLLLTTRGHVSGRTHTVPLLYLRDGELLVVIASYGGRPRNPTWYQNLVEEPRVEVQIDGDSMQKFARTADADERATWWPRIETAYDGYRQYQSRTERVIPVVFLDAVDESKHESG
ncbi:MAG TPA: nitroreductase family deazaflavin-dependent oxidoreductase [Acidimicrobiia bacterium]